METKENSIAANNRLIAEFMGFRVFEKRYPRNHGIGAPEAEWKDCILEKLKYHKSWSELMPVVEKIASIDITPPPNYEGYRMEIVVRGYVRITGRGMPEIFTNVSVEGGLIQAVYKAIVTFINFYNLQTQPS